jgi:hypothetical protein
MDKQTTTNTKQLGLAILKNLLTELPALTADIFYQQMRDKGFTEDEAVKFTGACIRTGAANLWMLKTNLCTNSRKNNSNLQRIWKSRLFKDGKDANAALARWQSKGFNLPLVELALWIATHAQDVSDKA